MLVSIYSLHLISNCNEDKLIRLNSLPAFCAWVLRKRFVFEDFETRGKRWCSHCYGVSDLLTLHQRPTFLEKQYGRIPIHLISFFCSSSHCDRTHPAGSCGCDRLLILLLPKMAVYKNHFTHYFEFFMPIF